MSDPTARALIFICYSRKDEDFTRDELVGQLAVLQASFRTFFDKQITPGEKWEERITKAIDEAVAAILVVSKDSLTSEYILKKELVQLLKRQKDEDLLIIPLIYRPCAWEAVHWLKELQVWPEKGALAGKEFFEREALLADLTKALSKTISRLRNEPASEPSTKRHDRAAGPRRKARTLAETAVIREAQRIPDRRSELEKRLSTAEEAYREAAFSSRQTRMKHGAHLKDRKTKLQRELAEIERMEAEAKSGKSPIPNTYNTGEYPFPFTTKRKGEPPT